MIITKHELKQNRIPLMVWTSSIAFLLLVCVFMFPEIKKQMGNVNDMFSSMGSFSAAFSMDSLNFGTLMGFYSVEFGNIIGLGGAFFASIIAINALAKEEKDHTAEFLLSHPITRFRILNEKLFAIFTEIVFLNLMVYALSLLGIFLIKEEIPWKEITLLHLAYFCVQIELAGICFSLSSFLRRGGLGIGIGIATIMYFLNIIRNISDSAKFLKYITPFAYADGADIVLDVKMDLGLLSLGILYMGIFLIVGYVHYCKKDIL